MIAQTFLEESIRVMAQINKNDCLKVTDALQQSGVSKGTFYTYLNYLDIQRHRFALDRNAYIHKNDFERLKKFIADRA